MTQLSAKTKVSEKEVKTPSHHKYSAKPFKLWQDMNEQEVRIEIVPMIDVIFCILTFFILAAVGFSRQQAMTLNLPKASTGEAQMREMLVVSLDNRGQLYLEKQPITQVQLYSAIKNYHSLNPSGLMVLHASQEVRYSQVIEVLDMLKEVGGERVALATLPGKSQAPSQTTSPYPGFNPYYPSYPDSSVNQSPSPIPTQPPSPSLTPPAPPALPPSP
ncbi:MAG: biopolymer transporter ExbD [Cyanobacteria bacterium]|jgi:biopolymer transport protein ExbD|uniref:ExbD/TolR family protein n=1 Tax=Geminocystis sp. TaxID=2664100 RepID=UPI001DED6144|nr:biopolymer transporter ExbD [Cyanobacteria bacterium CG_2015-16_32_12]NCO77928.1 biopolymer transporter ExbD [Cyanobacteria bacterium CG_2015-22_32_23]NCQ05508.1 biopolymer transporter ExbD [Cyanobacteria bacterium CG_2015-09_32_10]NCQ41505.1 biopolymer transporter ExbD [Cyanobacteria bacterium CG_2015-04_32_10]NCS83932.1 biopolymer transporter ExbD [Cyanobacteria bacterium CG_2015-02_32_10]